MSTLYPGPVTGSRGFDGSGVDELGVLRLHVGGETLGHQAAAAFGASEAA
jgi:hypothetical protein